jgi:hypothetical protein
MAQLTEEQLKAEREKAEREKAEKEKAEKERAEKEREEKEHAQSQGRSAGKNEDKSTAAEGGDWRVEVHAHEIQGGSYTAANQTINNVNNINRLEGKERKRIQPENFKHLSREDLERESDELIRPDLELLTQRLKERRLLFLTGAPESGKATIACTLGLRLGDGEPITEVLLYPRPLERGTEFDFLELAESDSYHNRLVIFKDVLAQKSNEFKRFVAELGEADVTRYSRLLAANRSYWLFTSDTNQIESREKLSSLGLLCELPPVSGDLLTQGLYRKFERLLSSRPEVKEHRAQIQSLIEAEGAQIAAKLGTLPRIERFVQEWLLKAADGSLPLDEALDRLDDLAPWFLESLSEDFETWSYVLALTLCQAAPAASERVSWIRFDQFRQALTRVLYRELKRKPGERNPSSLCAEEELRRIAAVEIDEANGTEACAIRFREDFYPIRLWKSLLGPGRQILGVLMPALREFLHSPEPGLRTTAARALGRIAELDPYGIAIPLLWEMPGKDRFRNAQVLGQVLRGMLGSGASKYRALGLRELRSILSHHEAERACIGILCLSEIGATDPNLALQEIRSVLSTRLAPRFEDLGKLHRLVQLIEWSAQNPEDKTDAQKALQKIQAGNVDPLLSDREREMLEAVYIVLADLCLFYDSPMELVDRLTEWSQKPEEPLTHLITIVALSRGGLIDILNRFKVVMTEGNDLIPDGGEECNLILYWAWRLGRETARRLGSFLEMLYLHTSPFPGVLRQALRKRWLASLKNWARQACSAPPCRAMIVDVFDGLISAESPEVRQEALHLLKFDPDFAKPDSDLEALAIEIITRTPATPRTLAPLASG